MAKKYNDKKSYSLFETEMEKNPIDFKMEIEQVFQPDDCTMVMKDYGQCQDYPCDDCTKRFLDKMCKNCWEEEKAKDNLWEMCKPCADVVHKELGGFVYPWNKREING